MDINYYDEHQEEFEAVKLALRGEMERIWGSMLKERGDNLDDEATYLNLFEELQYNFSPSSFSKLTPRMFERQAYRAKHSLFLSIFCEGENIFALYPAHMASGRLFIPGELKIFHEGTPILAPQGGAEGTLQGCVNANS